jgi:FAD/FMN-containing dehydrogenase
MISDFKGIFRTDDEARAVYAEAAGIARILPRGVAVPSTIDDVQTLVRWAHKTQTPIIPRGSGSSMAGGAIGDGIILDLSRMNYIARPDASRKRIWVEAGALRGDVEQDVRQFGLRFPPDPSSGDFCTIGGMVSTNAAGPHTLKYGPTRSWVSGLDCVFDDGSHVTITRGGPLSGDVPAIQRVLAIADELRAGDTATPAVHRDVQKDASGYGVHAYANSRDLIDLIIGSEGTLAIIVSIELMLTDAPGATSSLLGAFPTLEQATAAAVRAREAGAAACELLDRTFLDVAAQGTTLPNVPAGTEAILLAEVEGDNDVTAAHEAKRVADMFTASGATTVALALTPVDEHSLWELRHAASPRLAVLGPSLTSMQFIEDGAVPPEALPKYVRGIRHIFQQRQITGVIFGHAGDAHVHVNPLIDTSHPEWRNTVNQILDDAVALTAELGGTLTGEHGDGRLRTPLLAQMWPATSLSMFRLVKQAFDPTGIFNPGVKVPLLNQRPISDIKYDPELPALPPRAAAALARVTRDRAYAHFRLDLLDQPSYN